jgi:tRNA pseudouridine55 synthase
MTPINEGILLVDKPKDKTSFYLVHVLRKITGVKKIGHTGTLDPLATGVMVMLVGSKYTRKTPLMIGHDKEYETTLLLGKISDTYDITGAVSDYSDKIPSLAEIETSIASFQGEISQIPPMFSAKKVKGKKLYELARKGIEIERKPITCKVETKILFYEFPLLKLQISCSSGTYIRTIGHDIGKLLGTGALVLELKRTRSGPYVLSDCTPIENINKETVSNLLKE